MTSIVPTCTVCTESYNVAELRVAYDKGRFFLFIQVVCPICGEDNLFRWTTEMLEGFARQQCEQKQKSIEEEQMDILMAMPMPKKGDVC